MARKRLAELVVANAPFKSSFLAIPPSPCSPRLPTTPSVSFQRGINQLTDRPRQPTYVKSCLTPEEPLHWLWQCHKCHRVYRLGVTRRCLDDGHLFCAGTTTVKRKPKSAEKKVVHHQACASEFDYQGWKTWGTWRRGLEKQRAQTTDNVRAVTTEGLWLAGAWPKPSSTNDSPGESRGKDCWNTCDYPSECRWGKQYGVQTPVSATPVVPSSRPAEPQPVTDFAVTDFDGDLPMTDFDDILIGLSSAKEEEDYMSPLKPSSGSALVTVDPMLLTKGWEEDTSPAENPRSSWEASLVKPDKRKRSNSGNLMGMLSLMPRSPYNAKADASDFFSRTSSRMDR